MSSKVKCSLCERVFIDKSHVITHIDKSHRHSIPEGWTASRYENYLRTGKTHGSCVICKKDTPWNDVTGKYCRMCGSKECTNKARERAVENLFKKRKITHSQMLKDPEFQKKMIYSKKTSGTYIFSEDTSKIEVKYDSSYGKNFLEMLDYFMGWSNGCDIMGPSPNVYTYTYDGEQHFYIPDFYIPSLNLEIEIKDGGSNPNMHPKIQNVDKVKERLKDIVMEKSKVNYVKVINKNYISFFKVLYMLRERNSEERLNSTNSYINVMENTGIENSNNYLIQWFYHEFNSANTYQDMVSLYSKIDACIHFMKIKLNQEDINDTMKDDMYEMIDTLIDLKANLDNKLISMRS